MDFSDTTNKSGLVQAFERWTRMPDGTVTGTLLKQVTAMINAGFDMIMPRLLSYTDYIRWDDLNHTDKPVGTLTITSGQGDYKITEDDNSLDVLNFTAVSILTSTTATEYTALTRMTLDDPRAEEAISPSPDTTGVPTHWLENGNKIYLYPEPDYTKALGLKVFFEREQSYFASTDTTKEPGIPRPFHELLALYAALEWNMVNRSDDGNLISQLKERIETKNKDLDRLITLRNPTRNIMSNESISFR